MSDTQTRSASRSATSVIVPQWGDPSFIPGQQTDGGETQVSEGEGTQGGINNGAVVPVGDGGSAEYGRSSYFGPNAPALSPSDAALIRRYQEALERQR